MTTPTPLALTGWRVAVTGTARGIGRALALAAAEAGAVVIAHARTAADAASTVAAIADLPGAPPALPLAGDLRDPDLPERLAALAAGHLDALVLNAGLLGPMQRLEATDLAAFRDVMDVNVDAQLRLFIGALPALKSRRGRVVWLTSGLGHFALPGYGVYCVSKHAVEGLARLAAVEHAEDGLTSVAVAPGMVQTEMLSAALGGATDLSGFTPPAVAATRFVSLLAALAPRHSGRVLDLGEPL